MGKDKTKIKPKRVADIPVTKPFMPPREEYSELLKGVWERIWLTNNGPLVQQLEEELKSKLDLEHLLYVTNGTIALQLAIKALGLKGEIITTPFSYVATTSSIVWEGCEPVFVDIEPERLTIDPNRIEEAITEKTTGILATHVYGLPCFVEEIEEIAQRRGLKVIYDAAHAFGTIYKGKSLYDYGDISTASFHATKLFHSVEGGAVIAGNPAIQEEIHHSRNFGHAGPENYFNVGINGKNSEFHAAMGLVNLRYIDQVMDKRKEQSLLYRSLLGHTPLRFLEVPPDTDYNFAYVPVILESEEKLLQAVDRLKKNGIAPRRYFYPPLHQLDYVKRTPLQVVEDISRRVLCLPVYHELSGKDIERIAKLVFG